VKRPCNQVEACRSLVETGLTVFDLARVWIVEG
jgi:hypothetical protein